MFKSSAAFSQVILSSSNETNTSNLTYPLVPLHQTNYSRCDCVVFRMDDVQDYWKDAAQIAAMNLFITKNQSLSVGIIMHAFGNDSHIVRKVTEGNIKGLFELALHGWDHVDYTKLSEQQQRDLLLVANEKMKILFGYPSNIFITPYGPFNNGTILAMKQIGLSILSATLPDEERFNHGKSIYFSGSHIIRVPNSPDKLVVNHLPGMTFFGIDENGSWIPNSFQKILSDVDSNILRYGYAVIVFHPQDLVQYDHQAGKLTSLLNVSRVKELSSLIDLISHKRPVTTFSKILGIEVQSLNHNTSPMNRKST